MHQLQLHRSQVIRLVYWAVGGIALITGLIGIVLPVLPTTPFILLAAACFARSSARFHGWLLNHRVTGPIIENWSRYRSIPAGTKKWAYLMMTLSFGSSILIVEAVWLKGVLLLIALILFVSLRRIPESDIRLRKM